MIKCHLRPVYSARIQTHSLLNMSHLSLSLDQGSRHDTLKLFYIYTIIQSYIDTGTAMVLLEPVQRT